MKKTLVALALAGAAMLPAAGAYAQGAAVPVLIVDVERVVSDSAAGRAAAAQLKQQQDSFVSTVNQRRQQFASEEQTIQTQAKAFTAATPQATKTALQTRYQDLQQREQTAQVDLQNRQRTLQATQQNVVGQIVNAMNPIVQQIVKERGATVAVTRAATIAAAANSDITNEVISRLDRSLPRVNVTPPAAAAAPARR